MDRPINWSGAQGRAVDMLFGWRSTMTAIGKVLEALVGTGTVVTGLPCTPTSPASMQVQVGEGQIMSLQNLDSAAYSSLAPDTTHQIVKQGLLMDPVFLSCPAPSTTGQSINYLVQAAFQEVDSGSVVLPYFNSAIPTSPYAGPNNSNSPNYTQRLDQCAVAVKAGTAATTGSQSTPSPDTGYVGLYVVTVAYGQTTITSGNIAQIGTAPFLTTLTTFVSQARIRLQANLALYVATTGSDANNGLSSSASWATLQHAWSTIQSSYDLNGFAITVHVADGTYNQNLLCSGQIIGASSSASVSFQGDLATPTNCVINGLSGSSGATIIVTNQALVSFSGFSIRNTFAANHALYCALAGIVNIGPMDFGTVASGAAHIFSDTGGLIGINNSYSISGGGFAHIFSNAGRISYGIAGTIVATLNGTPSFSSAFAISVLAGLITVASGSTSFSGMATGARYSAASNGVIATNGGGANYFPGNAAGSSTGGVYS